jgi:hypothetical protein
LVVALVGAVIIWLITPYNDLVLNASFISDSYLPVAGLFYVLLLILVANPLLRRFLPAAALSGRQMGLVFAVILVASVLPGQGLMRVLPQMIAKVPRAVREDANLAKAYQAMGLPPSLFPDPVGTGTQTPASDAFLLEVRPGEPIPWGRWLPPLASWGSFLLFAWLMTLGMALIVYPQWRRAERLAFPLLTVTQSLIEEPEPGRRLPATLRERSFWVAAGSVFALHVLAGLNKYHPAGVPAVPLNFNLGALFTEEPFTYLPWWVETGRIYFTFVGAAFFMPNRTGLSVWFFALAYALYEMFGNAYAPPFHGDTVRDHRVGAMIAVAAVVLWLGRARWAHVARRLARRAANDEDRRDRTAGWMFLAGGAGMTAWMVWAGVDWPWALFFTALAATATLLIARIVAETGMPFVRIDVGAGLSLLKMWPVTAFGAATLWFSQVIVALFTSASRVGLGVMALHGIGLDDRTTARGQTRLVWLFLVVLALGVVLAGGAMLWADYTHTSSLDGARTPLSPGGTSILDGAGVDVVRRQLTLERGRSDPLLRPPYNQGGHLLFGAGLAGALTWACLSFPRWPLHPMGLLIVGSFYASVAWFSVLLGWLTKTLLVHYGGATAFRRAKPFFLGLIVGEVFAAVLWFLVPAIVVALGGVTYPKVDVVPQ